MTTTNNIITNTAILTSPTDALKRFYPPEVNRRQQDDSFSHARYGVTLGGVSFLIPQLSGSEVIPQPRIISIPNTPAYFLGVCNIRGNIVPVYDFFIAFNLEKDHSAENRILLLGEGDQMTGLAITQLPQPVKISEHTVPISELQPLPDKLLPHVSGGYIVDDTNWHELNIMQLVKTLSEEKQ